jgi:hypothetical protein
MPSFITKNYTAPVDWNNLFGSKKVNNAPASKKESRTASNTNLGKLQKTIQNSVVMPMMATPNPATNALGVTVGAGVGLLSIINCANPGGMVRSKTKVSTEALAFLSGVTTSGIYGYVVQNKGKTLSSLAVTYAGTANAEITALNNSTQWRSVGDQWAMVAYDKAGNHIKTVQGTINANGRIWNGYSSGKLTDPAYGFTGTEAASIDKVQFYFFDKGTLDKPDTTWARQPNDQITATANPSGIQTHSAQVNDYILSADPLSSMSMANIVNGKAGYRVSARDGNTITSVRKKIGNEWVNVNPADFSTNVVGYTDAINRSTNNTPYKQFVLAPVTMLDILLTGNQEYQVTFDGNKVKNFKFNTLVINQQLSLDVGNLTVNQPTVSVNNGVSDFTKNELATIGTVTWTMVNGAPKFLFTSGPAGAGQARLAATDRITFVADDTTYSPPTAGATGTDPYNNLPPAYTTFNQAANATDLNYIPLDHPTSTTANPVRSFYVARAVGEAISESAYLDFSRLTASQKNPNGGNSLYVIVYNAAGSSISNLKSVKTGWLADDPSTANIVEAKVPLLTNPLKSE